MAQTGRGRVDEDLARTGLVDGHFVDFEFAKEAPVKLVGAPSACKLDVVLPKPITYAQTQKLGEQFFAALTAAQNWGEQYSNKILVNCP